MFYRATIQIHKQKDLKSIRHEIFPDFYVNEVMTACLTKGGTRGFFLLLQRVSGSKTCVER